MIGLLIITINTIYPRAVWNYRSIFRKRANHKTKHFLSK